MPLNDDIGRDFSGLDVRETQEALADELEAKEMSDDNMDKDQMSDDTELVAEDEQVIDDLDAVEDDALALADENDEETAEEGGDDASDASLVADPVWNAAQEAEHLRLVEALLFAATEPLAEKVIATRLPEGVNIAAMLETLSQHYENRGVNLTKVSGKWLFVTSPDAAHILETEKIEPRRLSRAALETLAIIAYHQPCTRADIEDVRGVQVSKGSLDQLLEVGWVRLRGRRRDVPGRPVLYGTSATFLEHFALDTVEDLPGMTDLKAAGLLDARLPPGFSVPSPTDGDDDELVDEESDAEFAQDFMAEEGVDEAEPAVAEV